MVKIDNAATEVRKIPFLPYVVVVLVLLDVPANSQPSLHEIQKGAHNTAFRGLQFL